MSGSTAAQAVADYLRARGGGAEADVVCLVELTDATLPPQTRDLPDGRLELLIYGDVGFEVSARGVLAALEGSENRNLLIRINSFGGIGEEGFAIHNILARHAGTKTVVVDAVAASAASIVAMAGDEIVMPAASFLMIHNSATFTFGGRPEHQATMEKLARIDAAMAGIYQRRTGLPLEEIEAMMAAETWLTGPEAVAKGFATRVEGQPQAAPVTARAPQIVQAFARAPAAVLAMATTQPSTQPAQPAHTEEVRMSGTNAPAAEPAAPVPANPPAPPAPQPAAPPTLPAQPPVTAQALKPATLAELEAIAGRAKLGSDFVLAQLRGGATVDAARDAALEVLAAAGPNRPGIIGNAPVEGASLKAMGAAIAKRGGVKTPEVLAAAAPYEGATLRDMAADAYEMQTGRRARGLTPDQLFRHVLASGTVGMQSTSDFAQMLNGAAAAIVLDGYQSVSAEWRKVARTFNVDDFKPRDVAGGWDLPDLKKVPEHGEIDYGTISRVLGAVKLETFARGFAFTRQALINNDLSDFTSQSQAYGIMAAKSVSARVWRVFIEGTTADFNMRDGKPFLHADHGNLIASGSDVTDESLTEATTLMLKQSRSGVSLGLRPRYLVVGIGQLFKARKVIGVERYQDGTPNQFKDYEIVFEPSFPEKGWALVADPTQRPMIAVPLLGGREEPEVVSEASFDTFGIKTRVSLDYEAAPIDWNGLVFNPGPA
ncbi:head maturation protease, ClpP-related [Roseomonas xinghualingensis]|uniref:head maturation protease, ClpP-related n=1 Tax=Roseomonas xinghualingensis TaxID=2986475 RepID=UPI0021F0BC07|nr:head maturation protease, ClpP-related [Roseomonas sp. SXEYE001]MCV4209372.1 ATP-dependent Clp protease proteolytic subunit [Roseomonas sp. SXEYE001]